MDWKINSSLIKERIVIAILVRHAKNESFHSTCYSWNIILKNIVILKADVHFLYILSIWLYWWELLEDIVWYINLSFNLTIYRLKIKNVSIEF